MRSALQRVHPVYWLICGKLLVLAAGFSLLPLSSIQAADNLGDKLPNEAVRVLKDLRKHGYKNVGVLNFRVQNGNAPESFHVGPLNVIAARSLENALLLQNSEVKPEIGLIREAGAVAASHKERVSYLDPKGLDKLFGYQYPLAWGDQQVEADAFVTGVVKIDPDKKETTVVIQVVDRKEKKLRDVTHFSVPIERTILTDVCQSFTLAPDKVRKAGLFNAYNDDPPTLAKAANPKTADPKATVVELEILYNKKSQVPGPYAERPEAEKVESPKKGQEVVLVLRNVTGDQKAGVVLAVNGLNTLYKEDILKTSNNANLSRWILAPGERIEIKGFITKNEQGKDVTGPFEVISDAEAAKLFEELDPHPNLGSITLIVYTEGSGEKTTVKEESALRTPTPFGKAKPKTAQEAADLAKKTLKEPIRSADLIYENQSGKVVPISLTDDKLKDPQFQALRVIWFAEPKKKAE